MSENRYQVIYKGEFLQEVDRDKAYRAVAAILSVSETKARQLLNGQRVVLKKGLEEGAARGLCIALKQAGVRVALGVPREETPPAAPSPAPVPVSAGASAGAAQRRVRTDVQSPIPRPQPAAGAAGPKPAAAAATKRIPFEFRGSGSEYFRIWFVNILLTILTLGVYSAWAKVRNKQYFYGNTRVDGAGFEYLASPLKILKGRLLVGGVLVLFGAASHFFPVIHLPFALLMACAAPWLISRSLAFNACNSAWRNIRFGFKAGYGSAFKAFILWPALAIPTLGLLSPYAFFQQRKFLVDNTTYGRSPLSFTASSRDYYRIFMLASLPAVLGLAVIGLAAVFYAPLGILVLPLYLLGWALFTVQSGNLFYTSIRLGGHRLDSSMKTREFLVLLSTNTLATALTLGLFHPWAKVRTMRYKAQHLALVAAGDLNEFVADRRREVSAIGDASGDFFDFDLGL